MKIVNKLLMVEVLICLAAAGTGTAVQLESTLSKQAYLQAYAGWVLDHMRGKSDVSMNVTMPTVDVYNSSGAMIYHGEKVEQDVAVLNSLPEQTKSLTAKGTHPSLQETLQMVPALNAKKASVLTGGSYTVVSITGGSSACRKCPVQDAAVAKLKQRAGQAGINILELRLQ